MLSDTEIQKLAELARLSLNPEELKQFNSDLNAILEYVKVLQGVNVEGVEPMSHVHGVVNVFCHDETEESLALEKALSNAPDISGRFFKTPLIIE